MHNPYNAMHIMVEALEELFDLFITFNPEELLNQRIISKKLKIRRRIVSESDFYDDYVVIRIKITIGGICRLGDPHSLDYFYTKARLGEYDLRRHLINPLHELAETVDQVLFEITEMIEEDYEEIDKVMLEDYRRKEFSYFLVVEINPENSVQKDKQTYAIFIVDIKL